MTEKTQNIRQLVYTSDAQYGLGKDAVESILCTSRRKNPANEITGILIFIDGVFIQVLEGSADVIMDLYATISDDSRHNNVRLLSDAYISDRDFGEWAMAYLETTTTEASKLVGLSGTISRTELLEQLNTDNSRLKSLLTNVARMPG